MAAGDKPYKVYRGGRTKGKVPLQRRPEPAPQRDGRQPKAARRRTRRRWSKKRTVGTILLLLVLLVAGWSIASYLAFRRGVQAANARLDPRVDRVLAHQNGLLLSQPSNILLLGTDHSQLAARRGLQHSDSIMLVHTDPRRHRIAYLSIPRDLRVPIPGHYETKINAAFQIGGPALAAQTVRSFTGLPIDHVVIVDFGHFKTLIDKVGGVDVDVPSPILSNRFDCPFSTSARCQKWQGWSFSKGNHHLNGKMALIYSRIRENRLNPAESDVTRGERQQAVLQALMSKLASPTTFAKLPFIGGDLLRPLTTDLSPWQFMQLGWVKFRSSNGNALHCRLGGSASTIGGQSVIVGTQENIQVIAMVEGNSAPQPPPPGSGPFGPGCVVGSRHFR
jgi:LCP family protein required for cell wall assembly